MQVQVTLIDIRDKGPGRQNPLTSDASERWRPVLYTMVNTVTIISIELSVSREPATKRATAMDYEKGLNSWRSSY